MRLATWEMNAIGNRSEVKLPVQVVYLDDADTVGGLLLDARGELPAEGELIEYMGLCFEVLEVADNRIRRFAWRLPTSDADGG